MSLEQIDFSKTLTDDQVYESIMNNYSELANEWISHCLLYTSDAADE